jgi:predicted nicotinamide N-methyase
MDTASHHDEGGGSAHLNQSSGHHKASSAPTKTHASLAHLAPIGVGGLFGDDADEGDGDGDEAFQQQFEVQQVAVGGRTFKVRQFSFHCANANQVWPGAIRLGEYMFQRKEKFEGETILELGAATGLLAMMLVASGLDVITSDYCDDDGIICDNIIHNFQANNLTPPQHVPFTWGSGWVDSVQKCGLASEFHNKRIRFIVASDILLYVSMYPSLVSSLEEIFRVHSVEEFIMSWNRRIAESAIFFDLMKTAGFNCVHLGSCIYSFTR